METDIIEKSTCDASAFFLGAGDRGRTDTVSLPLDFESSTSANSITPAFNKWYCIIYLEKNQVLFKYFFKKIK